MPTPTNVAFFATAAELRKWFRGNHTKAQELWVGFYKRATGKPSITWPESVDEALCVGWIDGIRKSLDEHSYAIRFTPRRPGSIWSAVNIRRVAALTEQKRMRPAGVKAFAARKEYRSGIYSYEQRAVELPEPYAAILKKNRAAADFFEQQPASYRKNIFWWIAGAKKEETRMVRLRKLIDLSSRGKRLY